MKKLFLSALISMAAIVFVTTFNTSCSSNSDDIETPTDVSVYIGSWICTSSTDVNEKTGDPLSDKLKGETITIKSDGTYTSSSSNFGKTGKYVLNGNILTVTKNDGQTLMISISYHSGSMIWEGSANGYRFHYEFSKQS